MQRVARKKVDIGVPIKNEDGAMQAVEIPPLRINHQDVANPAIQRFYQVRP